MVLLTALALASAGPALASPEGGTGGATVPPATTGGVAVPGETAGEAPAGGGAAPTGGGPAASTPERSAGPPRARPPLRDGVGGIGAQAAQDQPPAPPTQEERDDGEVGVEVPLDEGSPDPGAAQPAPSSTPFGGLATTGVAVAACAAAAAAGLGLRRLAR